MVRTKSGNHLVVDVTEFLPGHPIPVEFSQEAELHGCWFFMPPEWADPAEGFGSAIGNLRGYPLIYSPGFPTCEEALEAAEGWEIKLREEQPFRPSLREDFWP
jgi:hypothetical protein